jgi:hypothetical protein
LGVGEGQSSRKNSETIRASLVSAPHGAAVLHRRRVHSGAAGGGEGTLGDTKRRHANEPAAWDTRYLRKLEIAVMESM